MPRSKIMRTSWTLRGRLQYILVKGLIQKKEKRWNGKEEGPKSETMGLKSHI